MSTATKTCMPTPAETDSKSSYIRSVLRTISECREARTEGSTNDRCEFAYGMIVGGLFLEALTRDEYDRMWDLASNANHYRFHELLNTQPPYTRKLARTTAQGAAA